MYFISYSIIFYYFITFVISYLIIFILLYFVVISFLFVFYMLRATHFNLVFYFSHNIYVEGLLFSRPWVCRDRIAGIELFRPPRGTRDSVIVIVVVVLYLALKLIFYQNWNLRAEARKFQFCWLIRNFKQSIMTIPIFLFFYQNWNLRAAARKFQFCWLT